MEVPTGILQPLWHTPPPPPRTGLKKNILLACPPPPPPETSLPITELGRQLQLNVFTTQGSHGGGFGHMGGQKQ